MKHPRSHVTALIAVATPLLLASFAARADGVEVVVRVSGIATSSGEIGCALFPDGAAFPMDASGARHVWIPAEATGVLCRFTDIPAGRWAVSVSHDLNGNRKVDTNLLGIPREAWGVSCPTTCARDCAPHVSTRPPSRSSRASRRPSTSGSRSERAR
jgi:uncharacterized protein (DUF2141 family)